MLNQMSFKDFSICKFFDIRYPSNLFFFVWLFSSLIQSIHLSKLMINIELNHFFILINVFLFCILARIITIAVISILGSYKKQTIQKGFYFSKGVVTFFTTILFFLWLTLLTYHLFYFKFNTPLLGSIRYTDFAIPPLTGLLNSLTLVLVSFFSSFLFVKPKANYITWRAILILICLSWSIIQMNRQVFISSFLIIISIYLFFRKINIKLIFKISVILCFSLAVFGFIGNIRSGTINNLSQISDEIPSIIAWVYMYIASPINNLIYNQLNFSAFSLNYSCALSSSIPSFLRNFFNNGCESHLKLVNESFNVSTMLSEFLPYIGYVGTFFLMPVVLIFGDLIYHFSRKKKFAHWNISAYAIFCSGVYLSIFANLLLHVVYLYAIFFCLIISFLFENSFKLNNTSANEVIKNSGE